MVCDRGGGSAGGRLFRRPHVRTYVDHAAAVLGSADVGAVVDFIRSYGAYAAVISFLLMVFSSVIAPLPAFLITFANAAIFGWWQGAQLSLVQRHGRGGSVLLHRPGLGRDAVEKYRRQGRPGQRGGATPEVWPEHHPGLPPAALRVL